MEDFHALPYESKLFKEAFYCMISVLTLALVELHKNLCAATESKILVLKLNPLKRFKD